MCTTIVVDLGDKPHSKGVINLVPAYVRSICLPQHIHAIKAAIFALSFAGRCDSSSSSFRTYSSTVLYSYM